MNPVLESQITRAVQEQDLERLEALLETCPSLKKFALSEAVFFKKFEVTEWLIKKLGASTEASDRSLLTLALFNRDKKTLKFLLDHGADPNEHDGDPLRTAADLGFLEEVRLLLQYGADPTASPRKDSPLVRAAWRGFYEIVECLSEIDKDLDDALTAAAKAGKSEVVFLLLSKGADKSLLTEEEKAAAFRALGKKLRKERRL